VQRARSRADRAARRAVADRDDVQDLAVVNDDHLDGAVKSFLISCAKIGELKRQATRSASTVTAARATMASRVRDRRRGQGRQRGCVRAMFEAEFTPYVAAGKAGTMAS